MIFAKWLCWKLYYSNDESNDLLSQTQGDSHPRVDESYFHFVQMKMLSSVSVLLIPFFDSVFIYSDCVILVFHFHYCSMRHLCGNEISIFVGMKK